MGKKDDLFSKAEGKLFSYNRTKVEIKCIEIDIEYLKKDIVGCRAISYTEKTGATNNISTPIEDEIKRKELEINKLERKKNDKEKLIKKIDEALNLLEEIEINIVRYRYFSSKRSAPDWKYIAKKIGYSEKQCRNIRDDMINKIKKII